MVFLETTPNNSLNTLEQDKNLKSPPSKKAKSSQESDAKATLWTALAKSLNSQTSSFQANIAGTQEKSQNTLAERGKTVWRNRSRQSIAMRSKRLDNCQKENT